MQAMRAAEGAAHIGDHHPCCQRGTMVPPRATLCHQAGVTLSWRASGRAQAAVQEGEGRLWGQGSKRKFIDGKQRGLWSCFYF